MLANQNGNRTVVARLQRQEARVALLASMLEHPPSRSVRRKLRTAYIEYKPSLTEIRRATRKEGKQEIAQRRAQFLGPIEERLRNMPLKKGRHVIVLADGGTLAITDEADKELRKQRAKRKIEKR